MSPLIAENRDFNDFPQETYKKVVREQLIEKDGKRIYKWFYHNQRGTVEIPPKPRCVEYDTQWVEYCKAATIRGARIGMKNKVNLKRYCVDCDERGQADAILRGTCTNHEHKCIGKCKCKHCFVDVAKRKKMEEEK